MTTILLAFAWIWIAFGLVSGAVIGTKFTQADWLGGYNSWQRRMVRLGHIAFIGTGLLCLAAAFTLETMIDETFPVLAGVCLIVGAVTMPTTCFLSALREPFRHLFFIPVVSLILGAVLVATEVIL